MADLMEQTVMEQEPRRVMRDAYVSAVFLIVTGEAGIFLAIVLLLKKRGGLLRAALLVNAICNLFLTVLCIMLELDSPTDGRLRCLTLGFAGFALMLAVNDFCLWRVVNGEREGKALSAKRKRGYGVCAYVFLSISLALLVAIFALALCSLDVAEQVLTVMFVCFLGVMSLGRLLLVRWVLDPYQPV